MPEYRIVDGPLAGQSLVSTEAHVRGETVLVELVDVGQPADEVLRYAYVVDSAPASDRPGRLRHARR